MKQMVPDYYGDFACIAGACKHSCCIGWEIDIDEDSLEYYRSVSGETGRRLQENIQWDAESPCFRLAEKERCPFLNRDNLCDLIIDLGEDSLCQICADHPRFRNFFSGREETGLGLCCEAAGRLILSRTEPVHWIALDDDEAEETLPEEEEALLALRDELTAIIQNRSLPMEERVSRMLAFADISFPEREMADWAQFFMDLERLDDAWARQLENLASDKGSLPGAANREIPLEQLMVYLLWRHLPGAMDDGDVRGRIAFCALIWKLLRCMFSLAEQQDMDTLTEICRLYSSEIEYSDENIGAILDELHLLDSDL